jgi:hypothetical protein
MDAFLSPAAAVGLALVHLLADRVHSSNRQVRGRWLSFAGGTSVAFVFLHLIPELVRGQEAVAEKVGVLFGFLDEHVYLAALTGVVVYYGAEHAALRRTGRAERQARDRGGSDGFFWIHLALFAAFNALIGFLLVLESGRQDVIAFAILWIALALHLFTNDFALRDHHRSDYHRIGRWLLAGAVLAGWAVGSFLEIGEAAFVLPLAFAAGGITLNALKEELPAERESHFGAFVVGAVVYAALMVVV